MLFQGRLERDGRQWLAEVPVFDAMTQGRTRAEALDMIADWFVAMVDQPQFAVRVVNVRGSEFEIAAADTRRMIGLGEAGQAVTAFNQVDFTADGNALIFLTNVALRATDLLRLLAQLDRSMRIEIG